jgi:hypothetical protein
MSATVEPKTFIDYFRPVSKGDIPVIECKVNMYPVIQLFLGDLENMLDYKV